MPLHPAIQARQRGQHGFPRATSARHRDQPIPSAQRISDFCEQFLALYHPVRQAQLRSQEALELQGLSLPGHTHPPCHCICFLLSSLSA